MSLRSFTLIFRIAGAILFTIAGWTAYATITVINSWDVLQARVITSIVASSSTYSENYGTTVLMYAPEVTFQYNSGGKTYTSPAGHTISQSDYATVKRIVDNYSPGSTHQIWVNPSDPNDVRFEVGYNLQSFLPTLITGVMGLVFLIVTVVIERVGPSITDPTQPS